MASQPPPDYRSYYADAAGSTAPPPTATQAAVQPAAPAAPVADGPAAVPPQSPGSAALASTGGPAPAVAGYYDRPAVFSHTATGAAARASGMHPPSQYPGHPSDYSHASAPAAHPHHAAPHPAHPHTAPPPHVHHGYDERERERDPYAAHPQVAAHAHAYPPPQPASHDGYAHPHHAPPHDPYHPGYTYSHPPPQQQQQQLQPPPPHRGGEYSHASHAMPAPASLRGGYDAASRYAPHPAAYPDPYADARSAQGYGHHAPPHAHHAAPESYASHGAQAEHVPRDPYARHADPYAGGYPHDPYRHDAYHAAAAPLRGSSTVHPDVANGYASHHAASRHAPQVYPPHAHPHGHAYADYGRHAAPSSAGPHGAPSGPHEYLHPSMPHLTSPSSHYAPSSHTPVGPSGAVAPASASAATPASASTITSAPTEVIDLEHRPISPETVPRSATNATSPNHDLNAGLSIANLVHDPASAGKRPSPAPTMTPEHAADGVSAAASALPHHQPAKPPPPSHEPPHHPPPYGSLSHPDHAHHLYSHGHHHHPSAHAHTHAHADPHSFPAVADVASTRLNPQPSTATETDPSIGPVAHALALPRRRGHRANSLHKAPAGSVPHEPADYHHHHLTTVSTAGPTPTNGAAPSDLSSATASATVSGATSPTSRRGPGRATGTTRKYHADPEAGTRKTSTAYFEPPVVRRRGRPPKSNPASGSESGTATRPRRASPASSTGRRGAQGMHDASPMLRKGASANPAVSLADATMMLEALEAGSSSTTKAVEAPVAPALAAPTAVLAATPLSATARAPGRGEPEPPSPFSSPDLVSDEAYMRSVLETQSGPYIAWRMQRRERECQIDAALRDRRTRRLHRYLPDVLAHVEDYEAEATQAIRVQMVAQEEAQAAVEEAHAAAMHAHHAHAQAHGPVNAPAHGHAINGQFYLGTPPSDAEDGMGRGPPSGVHDPAMAASVAYGHYYAGAPGYPLDHAVVPMADGTDVVSEVSLAAAHGAGAAGMPGVPVAAPALVALPPPAETPEEAGARIWRALAVHEIPLAAKIMQQTIAIRENNARKLAHTAKRDWSRWKAYHVKLNRDVPLRSKRLMREMLLFWKRNEREEREMRKRAEREALEKLRQQEEEREARRQARKLNFLISQTELYSHFVSHKHGNKTAAGGAVKETIGGPGAPKREAAAATTASAPPAGGGADGAPSQPQDINFDSDDEEAIADLARRNAMAALEKQRATTRSFDASFQEKRREADAEAAAEADGTEAEGDPSSTAMEIENGPKPGHASASAAFDATPATGEKILPQPQMLTCQLKSYQLKGLSWLANLYEQGINGILADEMGLGKTVQSISLMSYLAEQHNIWGPFLVISPASTLHNWQQEITKFTPNLKALPYWGNQADRKILRRFWSKKKLYSRDAPFHVLITSYQIVVSDERHFQRIKWQYMILDEAQAIKSSSSARWKTLLNFNCRNRLLLTGTPIQNSMQELWALLHFIMPTLFDNHEEFSDWFSRDIESHATSKGALNKHQLQRLHMILKPFMLRRVKTEVQNELGPKVEIQVPCTLTSRQRRLYQGLKEKISVADLLEKSNGTINLSGADEETEGLDSQNGVLNSLMNLVMQFRKVCNHPELFERADIRTPLAMFSPNKLPNLPERDVLLCPYAPSAPLRLVLPRRIFRGCYVDRAPHAIGGTGVYGMHQARWRRKLGYLVDTDRLHALQQPDPKQPKEPIVRRDLLAFGALVGLSDSELSRAVMTPAEAAWQQLQRLTATGLADWRRGWRTMLPDGVSAAQFTQRRVAYLRRNRLTPISDHRFLLLDNDYDEGRAAIGDPWQLATLAALIRVATTWAEASILARLPSGSMFMPAALVPPPDFYVPGDSRTGLWETFNILGTPSQRNALMGTGIWQGQAETPIPSAGPNGCFVQPLLPKLPNPRPVGLQAPVYVPHPMKFITDSGKMLVLDALLPKLRAEGHRVLIYFQMTRMIDLMAEYLHYRRYLFLRLDGSTSIGDRRDMVNDWQTRPELFVFLLSTRAGGLGINLTAADTVIFYDSDWNPTVDQQAMDRAHRLGQTKQVTVYRLVTTGTVEERILLRSRQKDTIQKVVIQGGHFKQQLMSIEGDGGSGPAAALGDGDAATQRTGGQPGNADVAGASSATAVGASAAGDSGVPTTSASSAPATKPGVGEGLNIVDSGDAAAGLAMTTVGQNEVLSLLLDQGELDKRLAQQAERKRAEQAAREAAAKLKLEEKKRKRAEQAKINAALRKRKKLEAAAAAAAATATATATATTSTGATAAAGTSTPGTPTRGGPPGGSTASVESSVPGTPSAASVTSGAPTPRGA